MAMKCVLYSNFIYLFLISWQFYLKLKWRKHLPREESSNLGNLAALIIRT